MHMHTTMCDSACAAAVYTYSLMFRVHSYIEPCACKTTLIPIASYTNDCPAGSSSCVSPSQAKHSGRGWMRRDQGWPTLSWCRAPSQQHAGVLACLNACLIYLGFQVWASMASLVALVGLAVGVCLAGEHNSVHYEDPPQSGDWGGKSGG